MNRSDLVDAVAAKLSMTKKDVETVVTTVFDTIGDTLAAGEKVTILGFGAFEVRERAARIGRNPRTLEPMDIAATRTPGFRAGKQLRDKVVGSEGEAEA